MTKTWLVSVAAVISVICLYFLLHAYNLIVCEQSRERESKAQYSVTELLVTQLHQTAFSRVPLWYAWHGNRIVLSDPFENGTYGTQERKVSPVKVLINGKDYSISSPVEIRPAYHDANRYWAQLMLVSLADRRTQQENLVLVQCVPSFDVQSSYETHYRDLQCRAVWISSSGYIHSEVFGFDQTNASSIRTLLADEVSPIRLGYCSDIIAGMAPMGLPIIQLSLLCVLVSIALCLMSIVLTVKSRIHLR